MAPYQTPKKTRWIVLIVVLVLAAIAAGIAINHFTSPTAATPTNRPSTYASSQRSGGTGFSGDKTSGYWRVTKTSWTATSLTVDIELTVDQGRLYYDFYLYPDPAQSDPQQPPLYPVIGDNQTMTTPAFTGPGETAEHHLTFDLSQQAATLVLIGEDGQQLSAINL
jgi:hypothetical protein